jgi:hypothetical protein
MDPKFTDVELFMLETNDMEMKCGKTKSQWTLLNQMTTQKFGEVP